MGLTCHDCKAALAEGTRFCTSCGAAQKTADTPSVVVAKVARNAPAPVPVTSPITQSAPQWAPAGQPAPASPGSVTSDWNAAQQAASSAIGSPRVSSPVTAPDHKSPVHLTAADVTLAHGEVVKRDYPVARVRRPFGWLEGHLVVTDARIIYRSRAKHLFGESRFAREVHLSKVLGAGVLTNRGLSPFTAVSVGLIWIVVSLLSLLMMGVMPFLGVFLWLMVTAACALLLWWRSRNSTVAFVVYSSDTNSSPVRMSGSEGSASGIGAFLAATIGAPLVALFEALGVMVATDAVDSADVADTLAMYEEIGALILDLQNRGVLGATD